MITGIYPGTFDPITRGHADVIARSIRLVDRIIVAVALNPGKEPLFELAERVELAKIATQDIPGVDVEPFDGLLVEYVKNRGAHAIIRGLRAVSDFEHEFQMALLNRKLNSHLETVFLMASEEYSYLTSSMVKEVASLGGPLHDFLHPQVAERLTARLHVRRS
ncbi:MAG: pantetheine-phosphate adenylyltransferase [Nitrospira sp.]|nr:pantetheine-phosphate adenylyltransferase [Nitrospira sp.]MCA9476781.1 pantetheine-phosphate adenylyltransferase [Nitrospira sp.]MCA9479287.1 pantetheine-phosphate adenylyltransferase [Nitrospira sp.]MCB9712142.1 pantetheine-phosphate adenylyltransferase [Nitrospiraceae bacterium]MDR4488093.1 pantetheine-phosphate adenylyltransferase [Nitrospirales bacterium]